MSRTSHQDNPGSSGNNRVPQRRAESIEQLRGLSRISGQSQLSTTRNKAHRDYPDNTTGKENVQRNTPNTYQANKHGAQSQHNDRDTAIENKSPGPISRTPSADRRLLRNLTVTPDSDDAVPTDNAPFGHPSPNKQQPSIKSRQSLNEPHQKSPSHGCDSNRDTIASRARGTQGLKILDLPTTPTNNRGVSALLVYNHKIDVVGLPVSISLSPLCIRFLWCLLIWVAIRVSANIVCIKQSNFVGYYFCKGLKEQ